MWRKVGEEYSGVDLRGLPCPMSRGHRVLEVCCSPVPFVQDAGQRMLSAPGSEPSVQAPGHRGTLNPAGGCSGRVPSFIWGFTLVQYVGLGLVRLGQDTGQGLDEVVLAGQLEHAFL